MFCFKMITTETFHQILSLMTVAFNEFAIGLGLGWIAPTLGLLQSSNSDFIINENESSWIASLDNFGKIFGALLAAFLLDIAGRKKLLTFSALVFFLMWVLTLLTKSPLILCLIRLLFGFSIGVNDGTNSNYLSENCTPKIRSVMGTIVIMLYYVGLLAETAISSYFPYNYTALINCFITLFGVLSIFWIKEPVQFFLMKGKIKQAEENFAWLHGVEDAADKATEFEKIRENAQAENLKKSSFRKSITSPANYKSIIIIVSIYFLNGSMGYFPVLSYTSLTFAETENFSIKNFVVTFSVFQLLIAILASFTVSKFNRRSIILICFSMISIIHVCIAALYYMKDYIPPSYFPWLVFISITAFASIFAYVYPVIFIIRGELFPLSIKATGGCAAIIAMSASAFLTTKVFLYVISMWGIGANFILFSAVSLISVVFVYFMLPETRNKTLIEIQQMLESKTVQ